MQYTQLRSEVAERVAAMWGMPPLYQGTMEGVGDMNAETQQIIVASRVVESDQRRFNEKVFPKILTAIGVEDWEMVLLPPEEQSPDLDIDRLGKRALLAKQMYSLGFDLDWQSETQTFKYKVPEAGLVPRSEGEAPPDGMEELLGGFGGNGSKPKPPSADSMAQAADQGKIIGAAQIARPGGRVRAVDPNALTKEDAPVTSTDFHTPTYGPKRIRRNDEDEEEVTS